MTPRCHVSVTYKLHRSCLTSCPHVHFNAYHHDNVFCKGVGQCALSHDTHKLLHDTYTSTLSRVSNIQITPPMFNFVPHFSVSRFERMPVARSDRVFCKGVGRSVGVAGLRSSSSCGCSKASKPGGPSAPKSYGTCLRGTGIQMGSALQGRY